ncbi:MAG TPA: FecR domain-containing protein [Methylomirabilota bacterium]|nr:FecR domain-containing protein [Methylomirabilota bacterium]
MSIRRLRLVTAVALVVWPSLGAAQGPRSIGVVATLSGEATVARQPAVQPQPLRFKDDVFTRDRISTAEKSILRVLLGGKALVTVRELSVLTIIGEPDRSSVDMDAGKIALGVVRQRMRSGEAVQVRTSNAIVAVRGTVVLVESFPSQRRTDIFAVREFVDVFLRNVPGAAPLRLVAPQAISIVDDIPGPLTSLGPDDILKITRDLQVPRGTAVPSEAGPGARDRAAAEREAQELATRGISPHGKCASIFDPCATEPGFTPPPLIPPIQPQPGKSCQRGQQC